MIDPEVLVAAHKHCFKQRQELERSHNCGCFYCLKIYPSAEIKEWTGDGQTAICPHCGINSVIGDASSLPMTQDFMQRMHERWFD